MDLEDAMINLTDLVSVLPVEVYDKILGLILILKAFGVFAIMYIVYNVIMGVLTCRRTKKIEQIEIKTNLIEKKIDLLNKKLGVRGKKN